MPASSTIDIYDHASANTNPIFSLVAADIKTHEIQFDTSMQNGIRVVTAGVTPVKMLVIFDELI